MTKSKAKSKTKSEAKPEVYLPMPFDSYFRASLTNPDIAIPFCKINLPVQFSKKIDYGTMRTVKRSFLSKELRNYACDVILEFDLLQETNSESDIAEKIDQKDKLQIAVIIEHQSTPDKLMPFRMMHYLFGYLYELQKETQSSNQLLTPVVPLLFYNGTESPYPYKLNLLNNFADPYGVMKHVLNEDIKIIDVNELEPVYLWLIILLSAILFNNKAQ